MTETQLPDVYEQQVASYSRQEIEKHIAALVADISNVEEDKKAYVRSCNDTIKEMNEKLKILITRYNFLATQEE